MKTEIVKSYPFSFLFSRRYSRYVSSIVRQVSRITKKFIIPYVEVRRDISSRRKDNSDFEKKKKGTERKKKKKKLHRFFLINTRPLVLEKIVSSFRPRFFRKPTLYIAASTATPKSNRRNRILSATRGNRLPAIFGSPYDSCDELYHFTPTTLRARVT